MPGKQEMIFFLVGYFFGNEYLIFPLEWIFSRNESFIRRNIFLIGDLYYSTFVTKIVNS